jgi:hypothetical protein
MIRWQTPKGWLFISICDPQKIAWFHISFGRLSLMWERS